MTKFLYSFTVGALIGALFAFTYPSPGDNGFATGEVVGADSMNAIETALDAIETKNTSQDSTLTTIQANYLPLAGGTMTGDVTLGSHAMTLNSGGSIIAGLGSSIFPLGSGSILATAMSASGQIDDNDLAAGAVDGGTGGEIADDSITAADIGTGGVASAEILDDAVALITDTAGDFIATLTGDTEITVSGAGTEGRAVTLAIASALTRDTELAAKSVGSSTDNAIVRFDGTTGDVQDSAATIADTTGTITTPGNLSAGGSSGASTIVMRNMADSGWVECGVNTTTWTCATDADGVADGTL